MGPGSTGFLDGWIDFNGDGSWAEPEDRICFSQPLSASGCDILFFQVPATATSNITTFARFRFSSTGYLSYDGPAQDGEVEDYSVRIGQQEKTESKWIQYLDLSLEGVDVDVTKDDLQMKPPRILADDFECATSEDLLDIHIWGSWYHDYLPFRCNPTGVMFTLSIHSDIPADQSPTGYSMPGPVLWTRQFQPGQFKACPQRKAAEGWYDPVADRFERIGSFRCWQYSFYLEPGEFRQKGTLYKPVVYWLAVQAQPRGPKARFGWKCSIDHWNDDAVWASPLADDWNEMRYPKGQPHHPESMDMAFQLTYTPEAPEQPTSRPVSHTQCPVVETQCPTVETECPPVETECPAVETECPAVETECPSVETECPAWDTECPPVETECPHLDTECPLEDTRCPFQSTVCPEIYTICPQTFTECSVILTQCDPGPTVCHPKDTECPPANTECPTLDTVCPPTLTSCQQVDTLCPRVKTKCPASLTTCPAPRTLCSSCFETILMCTPLTEGTKDSPVTAKCPAIEAQCPTVVPKHLLTKTR